MIFNPANWYWAADDGRVFSSARLVVVDKSDSVYMEWFDEGGIATRWPDDDAGNQTTASLQAVLTLYGLYTDQVSAIMALCAAACDSVTRQVNVSETHVPAYTNTATWVVAANGTPTQDPYKTCFASLAASMGTTPDALTPLIQTFDTASVNLVVALNVLKGEIASGANLKISLSAFEQSVDGEVDALNAALKTAKVADVIATPTPISIPGISA